MYQQRGRLRNASIVYGVLVAGVVGLTGCKNLVGDATLPPGTQAPNAYDTPEGARKAYNGVITNSTNVFTTNVITTAVFTDELRSAAIGSSPFSVGAIGYPLDARAMNGQDNSTGPTTSPNTVYTELQAVRNASIQAFGMLAKYAPDGSPALRGAMYATRGSAEILLAELYCSGVPLSTLDFEKDFTYRAGSSQRAVYEHALVLLDSGLALSADSLDLTNFIRVWRGRVLLDLGRYPEAGEAVATVPFEYVSRRGWDVASGSAYAFAQWTVSDREGVNGLPFASAQDPRVLVRQDSTNRFGVPVYSPLLYPEGLDSLVVASGIEAQLIGAEAALNAEHVPEWLETLNALRTDGTFTLVGADTVWNPGTGGVAGLAPMKDPGTSALPPGKTASAARVDLTFRERAFWLFLTGHRQGDLRRLVRNYGRPQSQVYPTGAYYGGTGAYGADVTLPISPDELSNPLFTGCLDRNA